MLNFYEYICIVKFYLTKKWIKFTLLIIDK